MRKINSILLVTVMVLGITACGKIGEVSINSEQQSEAEDSSVMNQEIDADEEAVNESVSDAYIVGEHTLGTYQYDGKTYALVFNNDEGKAVMSVDVQNANGEYEKTCKLSDGNMDYFAGLIEYPERLEGNYTVGGDDTGAYLLYGTSLYYIDYLTDEIFFLINRSVLALHVYDHSHFLVKFDGSNKTVYMTYDTNTNKIFESEVSTEEMKHMFDDVVVEPISQYFYIDENDSNGGKFIYFDELLPAGELIRDVACGMSDGILYLFTDQHVFRYDTKDGSVVQLTGELPGVTYFVDYMNDEICLVGCMYAGVPFGMEGYLNYDAGILMKIDYEGNELVRIEN